VYIPEYVVGHWWEQILHNQSALRLKTRLLFIPGLMVVNVPYQLGSAQFAPEADGDLDPLDDDRSSPVSPGPAETPTPVTRPGANA